MLARQIINILRGEEIEALMAEAIEANDFFTRSSMLMAIDAIVERLPQIEPKARNCRKVGVVCAGNIPLVGFWDMYNALLSGGQVYLKPSRRDPMMRAFAPLCSIVERLPDDTSVVLAMGSDQTMQVLSCSYPTTKLILRGTEHSAAVLTGDETSQDLRGLTCDIFAHSSLGCRSVTHLHLPQGYDPSRLIFEIQGLEFRQAWYNNYHQQRALLTMRSQQFIDGGYYLLREGFTHEISTIGYTFYKNIEEIEYGAGKVKSIVADGSLEQFLPCRPTKFGFGQRPEFEFLEF